METQERGEDSKCPGEEEIFRQRLGKEAENAQLYRKGENPDGLEV